MTTPSTLSRMRLVAAGAALTAAAGVAVLASEAAAGTAPPAPEPVSPATAPAPVPVAEPAFDPDDCPGCGLG